MNSLPFLVEVPLGSGSPVCGHWGRNHRTDEKQIEISATACMYGVTLIVQGTGFFICRVQSYAGS